MEIYPVVLNAGGIIAAIVGLLFGVGGIVVCVRAVASNDTQNKPWWGGGIVAGALIVVLAILTLAGVI